VDPKSDPGRTSGSPKISGGADGHQRKGRTTPDPAVTLQANGDHRRQSDDHEATKEEMLEDGVNAVGMGKPRKEHAGQSTQVQSS